MQQSSGWVKPYGLHIVFSVSIIMLHVAIGFGNVNVYENKKYWIFKLSIQTQHDTVNNMGWSPSGHKSNFLCKTKNPQNSTSKLNTLTLSHVHFCFKNLHVIKVNTSMTTTHHKN